MKTRNATIITLILALFALTGIVIIPQALAATDSPFEKVYGTHANGAITITGNTVLTCDQENGPKSAACIDFLNGDSEDANNSFDSIYVDADNDSSTLNSSRAPLVMEPGSKVLYAGLYWGAGGQNGRKEPAANPQDVLFKTPGSSAYQTITATKMNGDIEDKDYSAYADVTELVKASGAGAYWVANIPAPHDTTDDYAGWSLVVAYENKELPFRDLQVFSGYKVVKNANASPINIEGFQAPPDGEVNAVVGVVAYEGDPKYSNDYMELDGKRLGDALSPTSNFLNSTISNRGVIQDGRDPDFRYSFGIDAKTVEAKGIIKNNQTSAKVKFGTKGDHYYP